MEIHANAPARSYSSSRNRPARTGEECLGLERGVSQLGTEGIGRLLGRLRASFGPGIEPFVDGLVVAVSSTM